VAEKLQRDVHVHEFRDEEFMERLQDLAREDFLAIEVK
jgi:hypothetical protein